MHKYKNTIKNLLIKNILNNDSVCIYKILCEQCDHFYVGQTAKSEPNRLSHHNDA